MGSRREDLGQRSKRAGFRERTSQSLLSTALLGMIALLTIVPNPSLAAGSDDLRPEEIIERYGKAVVLITGTTSAEETVQGTGFLISTAGVLVTNFHVIKGLVKARVRLANGDVYDDPKVVDYDARKDLAVLKIKGFNLPTVQLGDSNTVKTGERIYVIGNPLGLQGTISDGLMSGSRDTREGYKLVQISAPISPGSSGSPVFNSQGRVIGVAVCRWVDGENLNFAVPVNYARGMIAEIPKTTLAELAKQLQTPEASSQDKLPDYTYDDYQRRITEALELKELGVTVDWHEHTWYEMFDWTDRIQRAQELKRLGVEVDWHTHSFGEMADIKARVDKAADLKKRGVEVDWQKYSLAELLELERKAFAK